MQTMDRLPPTLLVLLGVLLWSTGGLFIKLTDLDAYSVNLGRSLFAALIVAAFTFRRGLRLDAFTLFTSALYAATLSCFVIATKNTTAANAIFLQYTAPIYILILSPFILKERFAVRDLVTVALCVGGMSLFFVSSEGSGTAPNVIFGNLIALASGAFFGLYFIFLRHARSLSKNPALSVFYGNLLVVAAMLPIVASDPPGPVTFSDAAAILFLGVFQIGIAYILFTNGVARGVRPMDASIIGFIEPLFNPFWVFFFVGERPSAWAIAGGLVILVTVLFHTLRQCPRRGPKAAEEGLTPVT
jgi:drug/metabolite transporter, DME family